jgi:hypothetical protein
MKGTQVDRCVLKYQRFRSPSQGPVSASSWQIAARDVAVFSPLPTKIKRTKIN